MRETLWFSLKLPLLRQLFKFKLGVLITPIGFIAVFLRAMHSVHSRQRAVADWLYSCVAVSCASAQPQVYANAYTQ